MLANIFLVLPALPLLIVIFGLLGRNNNPNDLLIGVIIAVTGWAFGARQLRAETLVYGAAWYEYSTRDYTGWPTAANPYIDPVPNAPYMEYTLLHLTPAA